MIDTPGMGDTRGEAKDKENFDNILGHLMDYPEIHAICILLKPNNARLTLTFKYCIKELLGHLHGVSQGKLLFSTLINTESNNDNHFIFFRKQQRTFYGSSQTQEALTTALEIHFYR